MSKRILIVGCIGFGNTGDEGIVQVVTNEIRESVPEAEITIVSGNPSQTAEAYGVRAIHWQDPLAFTEAVRRTDLTILGGGGLFQDYDGFNLDAVLTREHWGLSFYIAPALLSAIYSKPLMLYAVGVGPLLSEHGRRYTKVAADIASRITVRDPFSKDLLASLGVPADRIAVTADPAFNLTPAADVDEIPEVGEWTSGRPAIAVCLRKWSIGSLQEFCEHQIAAALDDILENEGGRVLFVPFHLAPGTNDDLAVSNRVIALMRHGQNAAVLTRSSPPAEVAGILASADLVLGMRLHSVIFSLAANVPFVALEYDPKVSATTAFTGFEDFTIPLGAIEADLLAERMRQALRESERFRCLARRRANDLRSRAKENTAIAVDLLQNGSDVIDYGSDARTAIARLVGAQVAATENLLDRLQLLGEVVGQPVAGMPRFEMAEALIRKAREVQSRVRELESTASELAESRQEADRLRSELHNASQVQNALRAAEKAQKTLEWENLTLKRTLETAKHEADAARERLAGETRKTTQLSADLQSVSSAKSGAEAQIAELQRRMAWYESKSLGHITKRGLQVALDLLQVLTPGFLRSAVRKYYLDWFYFRIYPERRVASNARRHSV